MRHILVGGAGFLGRELSRQLIADGQQVTVVDMADPPAEFAGSPIEYLQIDIAEPAALARLQLSTDDAVHHLAAKLLIPNHPRTDREAYFAQSTVIGTRNLVERLQAAGLSRMVYWSTDMVYGPAMTTPRPEDHPRVPYGPYGRTKVAAEDYLFAMRGQGFQTTILRPRLIMGPGRLGIFTSLFKLIDLGLPVPLIGDGANRFQFVSVGDCARASIAAAAKGMPDTEINLGSAEPPTEYELLARLVAEAKSRSIILRTPAGLVKGVLGALGAFKLSPMDPEQYEIADQEVTLDITRAREILGWSPRDGDVDMLVAAYRTYREAG